MANLSDSYKNMNEKLYQENNYTNSLQLPCSPQEARNISSISSNAFDSMCHSQATYRNSNVTLTNSLFLTGNNTYCDPTDTTSWRPDSRFVPDMEKALKFPDKMETIEITSKDLSPASCNSSNIDLLMPDFYKNLGKDMNYFNKLNDSQWYYNSAYNNQKFNEYPSCAQVNSDSQLIVEDKTVKYCSIQRSEANSSKSYACNTNTNFMGDYLLFSKTCTTDKFCCTQGTVDLYNYENKQLETPVLQQYYCQTLSGCPNVGYDSIQGLEQCAEASNDESDIVVEESEEEVTDYSEDQEKRSDYNTNCVICNCLYTPLGSQFYFLTSQSPLTMSSQKPVFLKVTEILGPLASKHNYLCSQCLGLINTIDHLQLKLESCTCELFAKFEKTCKSRNLILPLNSVGTYAKSNKRVGRKPSKICYFRCKLCKKQFSFKKFYHFHLNKHRMKHRFLCEYCGERFSKLKHFKIHVIRHKSKNNVTKQKYSQFACKICEKSFGTNSHLEEHVNYCSGSLPYNCKNINCDKKFPTITKMKNHVKLKHEKKFLAICSICNIGFIKMSDYKAHMISHSTQKKFSCQKCSKSYKTLGNLNFHMKYHNKQLPFVCEICNKGFMRKEYLEAHVNDHNGIKNFECTMCDKKFVSQKNLDSHMKYHDGTVKKKNCNFCGKILTTGYEEHLRTHTNLREFECNACDGRFNTKGALAKHKKVKHCQNNSVVK